VNKEHPESVQRQMLQLFKTHEKQLREDVVVHARLVDWISMHGYLQLALRHPDTTGATRHFIEGICLEIEQAALKAGVFDVEIIAYLRRDQEQVEAEARKLQEKREKEGQ
jgi:hypothetical protein